MADMHEQYFRNAARCASIDAGVSVSINSSISLGRYRRAARFALENGLSIVVVEDESAPVFAYQTWFRVGSRDEQPSRTGIAHLFEHLMFKGTKKFASGTFDKEMERRGAQTNAATWVDWTYYTCALAARGDNLETVIDFESDRMTGLILDAQTFASELEVVKNERRLSVDDSLAGTLSESLMSLVFERHPYRWPTIGSMAHLEAATLDDLRQFYTAYYSPNNATIVVAGDVLVQDVLTRVARSYGPIARQQVVRTERPREPDQTAPRERVLHRPILAPQLVVGYHAPAQGTTHFAALEVLADALVAGDTGRLYQKLVTELQLATDVSGFVSPFSEPGIFELHVTADSNADPHALVELIQTELARVCEEGITQDELDKARFGLELGAYESLRDVEGCAESVGHYESNFGDYARAFRAHEAYNKVTHEELREAARSVFRRENRSVVIAARQKVEAASS